MARTLRTLLRATSLVFEELRALSWRAARGAPEPRSSLTVDTCHLEQRLLLSASPAAVVDGGTVGEIDGDVATGDLVRASQSTGPASLSADTSASGFGEDGAGEVEQTTLEERRLELVFVDAAAADVDTVVERLRQDEKTDFRVFALNATEDGVEQISAILAEQQQVSAVHLVSHGATGEIKLGASWLTAGNAGYYEGLFSGWRDALTEDADLLIYGCELAGSLDGQDLLADLGNWTGADIAASDDPTGDVSLGGDWVLEQRWGEVLSQVAFESRLQNDWLGVLAATTFQQGVNGYGGAEDGSVSVGSRTIADPGATTMSLSIPVDASQGLLRFDDLFGTGPGQIPWGSTINSVALNVYAPNAVNSLVTLHRLGTDWTDLDTWDSLGNGIQLDNLEAMAVQDSSISVVAAGTYTFSGGTLASTVQDWSDGETNYGWALINSAGAAVQVASSDAAVSAQRPRLTVDYTAPATTRMLTVSTVSDIVDAPTLTNFATLLSSPGTDGAISLREAILAANNQAGLNVIYLPDGNHQLALGSGDNAAAAGDLDITDLVTIIGASRYGTVIDGNGFDGVFEIRNNASAILRNLTITGGAATSGGAIHAQNATWVTLEDVRLVGNTATVGGAIYNAKGTLELINSELTGNSASSTGGGLENRDVAYLRTVSISGNTAQNGAGVNQQGAGSSLTLENGTVSGNVASVRGGGLKSTTAMTIVSSTIAFNDAASGGGISALGVGASVQLHNSILARNTSNNSDTPLTSLGFNLDSDTTAGLGMGTDIAGLDPGLQPLQLNGGDVQTHALLDGSVAVNAGTSTNVPAMDARGVARDVLPDIGALESSNAQTRKIYWVDDSANTLTRVNADGTAKQTLRTGLANPRGIAVDLANGYVYWTEVGTSSVKRAGLDGQNVVTLISSGLGTPLGIALDVAGGRMFIADDQGILGGDRILVANLDGSNVSTTIGGGLLGESPSDVVYDSANGLLYWTTLGSLVEVAKIHRAPPGADASTHETLVTASSLSSVFKSLDLDVPNNLMFWSEDGGSGQNVLRRAHLDGSSATTISSSGADPYGVAADPSGEFIVWVDPGLGSMTITRPEGGSEQTILIGLDNPTDVDIVQFVDNLAPNLLLTNLTTTFSETTDTTAGVHVADLTIGDDGVGTNLVSLSGADAALFEVIGAELRLRAGAILDFETQTSLAVTISVNDPNVGSDPDDSAPLTIQITNANDEVPAGMPDTYLLTEDVPLTVLADAGVLANDTDGDGNTLSATIVTGPTHGSLAFGGDGSFVYRPTANYFGSDSFTYRAFDGLNSSAVVTVTLSISDVSLLPTNEFRVNTTTVNVQQTSRENRGSQQAVAMSPYGDYVVVWTSADEDSSGWGVFGQRFDRNGDAQGGQFQINLTHSDDQQWASVAMDQIGRFAVTWTSGNQDGTAASVFYRVYNADGSARTGERPANTDGGSTQDDASIDMAANGDFVIAWEGIGPGDGDGLFARRFNIAGDPIDATEFRLNSEVDGLRSEVTVSMNDSGDLAAVWDNAEGVHVRRFLHTGAALDATETLVVAESTAGDATVELANDLSFVVAWRHTVSGARDSFFQRFDSSASPLGGDVRFHSTLLNDQTNPSLAMDAAGNIIVAWEGNGTGDVAGAFYRIYDAGGMALSGETRINQTTSGTQEMVSLAMLDTSNFVAVWSGNGPGDSAGVFARQFGVANSAPSISLGNSLITYTEDAAPLPIDSTLTISDADDTLLVGATVHFSSGFSAGQDLLSFTAVGGILGSYDASTGVLSFEGAASLSSYQTLLRGVSYSNSSDAPNTTNRTLEFTVDDGDSTSNDSRVVRVVAVNDNPTVAATAATTGTEDIATTFSHAGLIALLGASDAEDATTSLTISLTNLHGATVTLLGGSGGNGTTFTFQTPANENGNVTFDYRVSDTNGAVSNLGHGTIAIAAVNDAPSWSVPGTQSTLEESPLVFSSMLGTSLRAADVDAESHEARLTMTVDHGGLTLLNLFNVTLENGANGAASITLSGTLTNLNSALEGLRYLPGVDYFGDDTLRLTYSDEGGTGGAARQAVTSVLIHVMDVNDAGTVGVTPVVASIAEDADTSTALHVADIVVTDDSLGTNTLSLSGADAALFSLSGNRLFLNAGTLLDYEQWRGYDVTVVLEDASVGDTPDDTADWRLLIDNINDNAPVATGETYSFLEDQLLHVGVPGLLANDVDADGDLLTVHLVDGVSHGVLLLSADGSFDYLPNLDYVGPDSFRYEVRDGAFVSAAVIVTLDVAGTNDAPDIVGPPSQHVEEDQPATWTAISGTAIQITDRDAGSQPLSMSLRVEHGQLFLGNPSFVTMVSGGQGTRQMVVTGEASRLTASLEGLRYLPDADFAGADWLEIIVDDSGFTGAGGPQVATASLAIDVGSVDDPPQIVTNHVTMAEEQAVPLMAADLRAVDPDPGVVDIGFTVVQSWHVRFEYLAAPGVAIARFLESEVATGLVWLVHDGSEMAPGYVLTASDGALVSSESTVDVDFVPVNDAPLGTDQEFVVDKGAITMDLLEEASDIEGDRLSVHIVDRPEHGSIMVNLDGTVRYVPNQQYLGADSFTYQVWDGTDLGNVSTVKLEVLPASSGVPSTGGGGNNGGGGTTGSGNGGSTGNTGSTGEVPAHTLPVAAPVTTPGTPDQTPPQLNTELIDVSASPDAGIVEMDDEEVSQTTSATVLTAGTERRVTHSERTQTSLQENSERTFNTLDVSQPSELSEFVYVTHSGLLWNELDRLQQDIGAEVHLQSVVVGSVGSVASGFTVGYVLWAIRSGFILSSLLASMPAWTLLDPLAVVSISDNEIDGDEESLEQLVEERSKEVSQKKDDAPC